MTPPTALRPDTSRPTRLRAGLAAITAVVALAGAVGLAAVAGLSSRADTVARITFENPTPYALDIEVGNGDGKGWTSAGSVRQNTTAEVDEVVDQGDLWVFRFDSQGSTGGELQLSRTELEAAGWRISIPAEVGDRLAAAGAPPTP